MKTTLLIFALLYIATTALAQQSTAAAEGTVPDLVKDWDSTIFKNVTPGKNGFTRLYQVADPDVSFISGSKSRIDLPGSVLICEEGNLVNGQRQGVFTTYVTDKADHNKKYKIHEQDFKNNLVDGHWKGYDVTGTLKFNMTFVRGHPAGFSVYYGPDGKTATETSQYTNDSVAVITQYSPTGAKKQVQTMARGIKNGPSTIYYPNGTVMSTANFTNGQFNDTLKYYYSTGVLWTEEIFKNGLDWTVLNNFDSTGKPRDAGTLKNGNGTRVLYTEEGEVRQVVTYVNGVAQ